MTNSVDIRTQIIWRDADGIVHAAIKPSVDLDLADAEEALEAIRRLSGGERAAVLVDLRPIRSMSRAARLFFAGPKTAEVELAAALVIASPLTVAIGNFFMGLNRPMIPTRLFAVEAEALTWLKGLET